MPRIWMLLLSAALLVGFSTEGRAGFEPELCVFFGGDIDSDGFCEDLDNCPGVFNLSPSDPDGDGRGALCDNCTAIANGPTAFAAGLAPNSQCDKDSDGYGYGNACDGDFDGNGFVTPTDSPSYLVALGGFFPPPPGQHDMDCNGFMTPLDSPFYLAQLGGFFVGPSGWACKGLLGLCPPLP